MTKLQGGECGYCVMKRTRHKTKLKHPSIVKEGGAAKHPATPRIENRHTGYPETTNATKNNKRYWNQLAVIGSKYLSGNNLPRISLIRGKLFPDRQTSFKQGDVHRTLRHGFGLPRLSDDFLTRNRDRQLSYQRNGFSSVLNDYIQQDRRTSTDFRDRTQDTKSENQADDIKDVTSKLETFANSPLLANWKITGYTPHKVILSKLSDMETQVEVSPGIVQYVKERDAAKEEMKKAQDELSATQSKLYDALQKIEDLEKKLKNDDSTKSKAKKPDPKKTTTKKPNVQNGGLKAGTTNSANGGLKASTASLAKSTSARSNTASSCRTDGVYHPPIVSIEPCSTTEEYYWKVAEQFPSLPMFQILDAERKFIKADADSSGYIDKEELDKVLTETITMFTPKQVDEIFNEVDTDKSNTVDFYEVLVILNKLSARRKTNLPPSVTQNYSKTCSIQ